jgi:tetratricopeptide (TPR) repeat protein
MWMPLLLKAAAFIVDKEYDPGEKILMDLYQAGVTSPDLYMMLFSLSQSRGDNDAVRAYLMEGVQKNPDHAGLIQYLAQLDANEKQFDAAAAGLEKVIALDPEEIRHKLNLARLLNRQGKSDQAEALLDKVLADNPGDEQMRLDIAGFWVTENRVEKAENIMGQGLELTPKSFKYHRFLADILARTGQIRGSGNDPEPGAGAVIGSGSSGNHPDTTGIWPGCWPGRNGMNKPKPWWTRSSPRIPKIQGPIF